MFKGNLGSIKNKLSLIVGLMTAISLVIIFVFTFHFSKVSIFNLGENAEINTLKAAMRMVDDFDEDHLNLVQRMESFISVLSNRDYLA